MIVGKGAVGWLVGWLLGCLVGLTGWLNGCLVGSLFARYGCWDDRFLGQVGRLEDGVWLIGWLVWLVWLLGLLMGSWFDCLIGSLVMVASSCFVG